MPQPLVIPQPLNGLDENWYGDAQPEGTTPSCLNVLPINPSNRRKQITSRSGFQKYLSSRISGSNPVMDLASVVKYDDRTTYTVRTSGPTLVTSTALPGKRTALCMAIDPRSGDKYVGCTEAGSGVTTQIYKYVEIANAGIIEMAWSIDSPNAGAFVAIAVKNGTLYAVENTSTVCYLHQYQDIDTANPTLVWSSNIENASTVNAIVPISVDTSIDGGAIVALCDTASPPAKNGILRKFGPNKPVAGTPDTPVWSYTGTGVGQAIVCADNGSIYTQGFGAQNVRKLTDNGTTVTSVWATATTPTTFKGEASLAVDAQGNVYQAIYAAAGTNALSKLSSAGAVSWTMTFSTVNQGTYCVVVDPFYCDKDTKAEYLYIGGDVVVSGGGVGGSVHKLGLVDISIQAGSPRSPVLLGVAAGNIVKFTTSGVSTPSGGSGALDSTSQQICSAAAFGRVLYGDGKNAKSYDVATDTVSEWKATTAGEVPRRFRLIDIWSGRAVCAGAEDDPQNWYMSAAGDFDDWDYFPPTITPEQAISGNNAEAGRCPDIITAIMPISDDLLLFGGDKSIWRMTGNPNTGGRFDLISEQTGVAFGRAWTKDPSGIIYFIGSQGGLYRMAPGGQPESVSDQRVQGRLNDIDIGANKIRLLWDNNLNGLWLTVTPYTPGDATHYFWYQGNASWWPISFQLSDLNPMSCMTIDGDGPNDRINVWGCTDGYVRYFQTGGVNDDSDAVESHCWFGPFSAGPEGETKLNNLRIVLTPTSDTLGYEMYTSDESAFSTVGASVFSGTVAGGRNGGIMSRARGMDIWLKLTNSTTNRAWAVEQIAATVTPGSRPRPRAANS
jgi:hypothetical protein